MLELYVFICDIIYAVIVIVLWLSDKLAFGLGALLAAY